MLVLAVCVYRCRGGVLCLCVCVTCFSFSPRINPIKCLWEVLVWGFGVLFLLFVCVSVSGVLFSVVVCVCDLLIFFTPRVDPR